MTDSDQSTAAATRPHRPEDDREITNNIPQNLSMFARVRNFLTNRSESMRNDLQTALQQGGTREMDFTDGERAMLTNVLKLSEMRVEDVMVPRADIVAVDSAESLGAALNTLREAAHSRVPVYEENLDNIVGMLHIKDLVERLSEPVEKPNGSPIRLKSSDLKKRIRNQDFLRKVLFVPPSMPVADLLQSMQATRVHMAIVVDEYGGTDGLATIEDLLEAVVGDIEDEHDEAESTLVRRESENVFRADARASLEELQNVIGPEFDASHYAEDADTLGGLVFSLIDRVPVKGEIITRLKGFDFEILQADPRRIKRVRIVRRVRALRVRPKPKPEMVTDKKPDSAIEAKPANGQSTSANLDTSVKPAPRPAHPETAQAEATSEKSISS